MNGAALERAWLPDLTAAIAGLYPDDVDTVVDRLVERARRAADERSAALRARDQERLVDPGWYQSNERVGYMAYLDRFAHSLRDVDRRIPYLRELGIDTLHFLSVLRPREGESDGGYAVRDYLTPDPRVGTTADLLRMIGQLHDNGIDVSLDFVLNHTSDDHEWAIAARNGSSYHQALYRLFPDRTAPDQWETSLPEVFPDMAPGNFTWNDELGRWVWTTFREFQWDLDYSNPDVLVEMAGIALALANYGVDILRLDAIAFTWKRLGTNCQNQPEAHLIAQALRATVAMAAPATILLAEAIVGPADLLGYLGRHDLERRECELAYHNQLMVQSWSMIATRRSDLARRALSQLPDPPARSTWFTYVRCHDDIGWAIDDADAAAVGVTGAGHRSFLAEFFRGDFPTSFARGTPFGVTVGDERTSGMASTLAGIEAARRAGDAAALARAIDRVVLLYAIAFGWGGIPIVYMGDELCQGDDRSWADDPDRHHDSRWAHRPMFDEQLAALRTETSTITGQVWSRLRHLIDVRRASGVFDDVGAVARPFDAGNEHVFGWHRIHPRWGSMIGLANVGETAATVVQRPADLVHDVQHDLLAPDDRDPWLLRPLQVRWLASPGPLPTSPRSR
ncbi:MAG: alpha-amylase [Acidimicrobiaceae bacterium]|nr:alpha-amylase [Acidimicrobiaceae bacterium]